MAYDPDQLDRYFAMARNDLDDVIRAGYGPQSKSTLYAAGFAWSLASWVLLAERHHLDFGDAQEAVTEDEKDREVETALAMPELDRALETFRTKLVRCGDGPSWYWEDGKTEIERATFDACLKAFDAAFTRIDRIMHGAAE